jgi:hypothetical protein
LELLKLLQLLPTTLQFSLQGRDACSQVRWGSISPILCGLLLTKSLPPSIITLRTDVAIRLKAIPILSYKRKSEKRVGRQKDK